MFDRLVGEAYVLMRADGRLLKKDISDTTKKNAKAYRDSFDREMKAANKIIESRFKKAIAQATAEVDFSKFREEYEYYIREKGSWKRAGETFEEVRKSAPAGAPR